MLVVIHRIIARNQIILSKIREMYFELDFKFFGNYNQWFN